MTAQQLANLTLDVWRASGARSERRRHLLLYTYAESYFGPSIRWNEPTRELVTHAEQCCRQRTRIDELTYA